MIYETNTDRQRAREIIFRFCAVFGYTASELPPKYALDFALLQDGEIGGLAEVKDRPEWNADSMDRAGGYMLSAHKVAAGLHLCELADKRFILVIHLSDGIWWVRIDREAAAKWPLRWFGGYNVPRRNADKEPVFMIPMRQFRRLEERDEG